MVWIQPKDETTFVLFRLVMTGMGLATSGVVAFWMLSRWKVQGVIPVDALMKRGVAVSPNRRCDRLPPLW